MTALVVGETEGGALRPATRSAVAAALQMSGDVHILVTGHNAHSAAEAAAAIPGVAKVLLADGPQFERPTAEAVASQVLAAVASGSYSHVLAAATGFGKNAMPRVAAKLDVAQISEITSVVSPDTFIRPIYAGNAFATVQATDGVKVITVRTTGFDPSPETGGTAVIETIALASDPGLSVVIGQELTKSDRPELTGARVVISGGRGLGSGENFKLLEALAARLNAALGASRAAVDAGYVPNDYQVGQTGKIVAPDLYIAVGISGAIQHLAGMKDSKVIVAINKDPDAPIFQIADYGLVGDLFEIIPQLTAELG